MRTTLTIPDEYYQKVKKALPEEGYQTVNALLLDLLRHHFDAGNGIKKRKVHHNDAEPQVKVTVDDKPAKVRKPKDTTPTTCKHGYIPKMCKFEACRRK